MNIEQSPYKIADEIKMAVTRGISNQEKFFIAGLYPQFIMLGATIKMNSSVFDRGLTMTLIEVMNVRMVETVNAKLKSKCGRTFLPINYSFLNSLWYRELNKIETHYLDRLIDLLPKDTTQARANECELLVLGCIELTMRDYYKYLDRNLKESSIMYQLEIYAQTLNGYLLLKGFMKAKQLIEQIKNRNNEKI